MLEFAERRVCLGTRFLAVPCLLALGGTISYEAPKTIDLASGDQDVIVYSADPVDHLGDQEGLAVGDLNDDGAPDLVLGAYYAHGIANSRDDSGEVHVFFGPFSTGTSIDIQTRNPDISVYGAEVGDWLGWAVLAEDISGDGCDDLIVSAKWADGPGNTRWLCGEVYAFFGPFLSGTVIDVASGTWDLRVMGADTEDRLGTSIAVGDLSVDGEPDLVIGAPLSGGGGNLLYRAGECSVIFGPFSRGTIIDLSGPVTGFTVYGGHDEDFLGDAVRVGDISGDGKADLIIGAVLADGFQSARVDSGEAYIVFGPLTAGGSRDLRTTSADVVFFGADAGDNLGSPIAVGDVTGDGINDLLLAARFGDGLLGSKPNAGELHVLRGPLTVSGTIDLNVTPGDLVVAGADAGDLLGRFVISADVSGDGCGDVFLVAGSADGPAETRVDSGEAYFLLGPLAAPATIDLSVATPDGIVYAAETGDFTGFGFGAGGDLSGDGIDDIALGAPAAAGPLNARPFGGEAYVFFGCDGTRRPPEVGNRLLVEKAGIELLLSWSTFPPDPEITHFQIRRYHDKEGLSWVVVAEPTALSCLETPTAADLSFYEVRSVAGCWNVESDD